MLRLKYWLLSLQLLLLVWNVDSQILTTRPIVKQKFQEQQKNSDEYNPQILDPDSLFGAPYGGYSRATRSRLSALPLRLASDADDADDDVKNDLEETNGHYQVRDAEGRLYVCRTYHQDELEEGSLLESMFDMPKVKSVETKQDSTASASSGTKDGAAGTNLLQPKPNENTNAAPSLKESAPNAARVDQTFGSSGGLEWSTNKPITGYTKHSADSIVAAARTAILSKTNALENDASSIVHSVSPEDILKRLEALNGGCTQFHAGWWSYEWCHGKSVIQFHAEIKQTIPPPPDAGKQFYSQNRPKNQPQVVFSDETKIGTFKNRQLVFDTGSLKTAPKVEYSKSGVKTTITSTKDNMPKYFVRDLFDRGDICPDTRRPRQIEVVMQCCSEARMNSLLSPPMYKGSVAIKNLASIFALTEEKLRVCNYRAMVCVPLLCLDNAKPEAKSNQKSPSQSSTIQSRSPRVVQVEIGPDSSIRDIIKAKLGQICLQKAGGWWVYEFCHGNVAREYHPTTFMDKTTGMSKQAIEDMNILGRYDADEHEKYPKEDEIKHVVTPEIGAVHESAASDGIGGKGPYYFQEYRKGDICNDSDVTDAAITGGSVVAGGIERSTTVRFSCGPTLELVRVNEDSTCHYIIDVTIPALCDHALFKTREMKSRVVKCLPVNE